MMYENYNEIAQVVQNLEIEIFEQTGKEYLNLEMSTNGMVTIISFLGIQLWNSDDDMRSYDEEKDEYEPLENYLVRAINEELEAIKKINL